MKLITKELKLILLYILPTIILSILCFIIKLKDEHISMIAYYSLLLGIFLVIIYLKKENVWNNIKEVFSKPNISFLFLYLIVTISWSVCSSNLFFHLFHTSQQYEVPPTIHDVLGISVISPITEEIVFRYGFMEIGKKYSKTYIVSILGILSFALFHFGDLSTTCSILVASAFLYYIYLKTGNLWYSLVAHVINNLISIVSWQFPKFDSFVFYNTSSDYLKYLLIILSFIFGLGSLITLNKKLDCRK